MFRRLGLSYFLARVMLLPLYRGNRESIHYMLKSTLMAAVNQVLAGPSSSYGEAVLVRRTTEVTVLGLLCWTGLTRSLLVPKRPTRERQSFPGWSGPCRSYFSFAAYMGVCVLSCFMTVRPQLTQRTARGPPVVPCQMSQRLCTT